jgi:hypothetical protein
MRERRIPETGEKRYKDWAKWALDWLKGSEERVT